MIYLIVAVSMKSTLLQIAPKKLAYFEHIFDFTKLVSDLNANFQQFKKFILLLNTQIWVFFHIHDCLFGVVEALDISTQLSLFFHNLVLQMHFLALLNSYLRVYQMIEILELLEVRQDRRSFGVGEPKGAYRMVFRCSLKNHRTNIRDFRIGEI